MCAVLLRVLPQGLLHAFYACIIRIDCKSERSRRQPILDLSLHYHGFSGTVGSIDILSISFFVGETAHRVDSFRDLINLISVKTGLHFDDPINAFDGEQSSSAFQNYW